jgi:hypothetical protein
MVQNKTSEPGGNAPVESNMKKSECTQRRGAPGVMPQPQQIASRKQARS